MQNKDKDIKKAEERCDKSILRMNRVMKYHNNIYEEIDKWDSAIKELDEAFKKYISLLRKTIK